MSLRVKIGTYHQKEAEQETEHTSYAADHIEHVLQTGEYDANLIFVGGYIMPMPQWLIVRIDSKVVGGGYYNGFGGVNYGFTPARLGSDTYSHQFSASQIADLVSDGKLTLLPEYDWLAEPDYGKMLNLAKEKITWEKIAAVAVK